MSDAETSTETLRGELDRLRREIQQLRIELAEARGETHAQVLTRSARAVTRRMLATLRRSARAWKHERSAPASPPSAAPYVVRPRPPAQPTRARVLHVIANFHLGGSARLVVDLFERLSDRYAQSVVSNDLPAAPAYVGIPVEHHPQTTLDAAIGVLRRQRPAFVHVHYLGHHRDKYGALDWEWYRHWFAAAEKLDVRVIENVNIPTTPFISNAVAVYVHVSDYVRERFGQREGRHVTIYPGSDFSTFAPSPSTGMAADCLGMVYRLQRDKLDERAIEPFIEAVRLRPATRAVIVGDGPLLEPFRRRVREARMERAFTFTGSVAYDQLPALYRQMSVFVAPIHCESFGQVTPFAMGMGLPVIGYDVGALLEIVGDRSTLTPPGDSQRLGELAAALLDDPARRADLGAANRARAERLFSVESMIAGYEPLYAELARPAGGDDGTG